MPRHMTPIVRRGRPGARVIPAHMALPDDLSTADDGALKEGWEAAAFFGAPMAYERIRAEIARRAEQADLPVLTRRGAMTYAGARAHMARV